MCTGVARWFAAESEPNFSGETSYFFPQTIRPSPEKAGVSTAPQGWVGTGTGVTFIHAEQKYQRIQNKQQNLPLHLGEAQWKERCSVKASVGSARKLKRSQELFNKVVTKLV